MKLIRKTVFWLHLVVGLLVGVGVAFMAGTGLLMAFQHPILERVERYDGHAPDAQHAQAMSIENLLESAMVDVPDTSPTGLTAYADLNRPAAVQFGRERVMYLNNYTAKPVGTEAARLRGFFQTVEQLHRWLAATGDWRRWGQTTTGVVNLGFLTLVVSGLWLWLPRRLKWKSFKPVLVPNLRLKGKSRDWNWHNVVGFWVLVPALLGVVLTGTVMSFDWAGNLVYRAVGETPPAPRGGGGERGRTAMNGPQRDNGELGGGNGGGQGGVRRPLNTEGYNDLWTAAENAARPGWTSIALRLGGRRGGGEGGGPNGGNGNGGGNGGGGENGDGDAPRGGVAFVVSYGNPLSPVGRVTYTFDRRSGDLLSTQTFADQTLGRRLRALNLPIHRGEVLGLPGMTIAAAACVAALVLVYTGFALSWRRLVRPVLARRRSRTSRGVPADAGAAYAG